MKRIRNPRLLILLGSIVIILLGGSLVGFTINTQDQAVSILMYRLKQENVPVTSVTVKSRVPLSIEVTLQSKSDTDYLSFDDSWYITLASRESTLAYRSGTTVSSYQITVVNTKGQVITSWEIFLSPSDYSQEKPTLPPSRLDNPTTANKILSTLPLGKMTLAKLDVYTDNVISNTGQILEIDLTAPDLEAANQSFPSFVGSLNGDLSNMNNAIGTSLILCLVTLTDEQGNTLLTYAVDIEGGGTQWSAVKGFTDEWYPHPAPDETSTPASALPVNTATLVPTVSSLISYPPPGPTATSQPYP